jgi:hypothetical protein
MLLLPAPDLNEPIYSIEMPPFDGEAYRQQLMADVIAQAEQDGDSYDYELVTDILLDYAEDHLGNYNFYDIWAAMSRSEELRPMLMDYAAGWDAAVALTQR